MQKLESWIYFSEKSVFSPKVDEKPTGFYFPTTPENEETDSKANIDARTFSKDNIEDCATDIDSVCKNVKIF